MQGVQQNSNQLLKFTLFFFNCFCAYFLLLSAPSPYNKNEKTQALVCGEQAQNPLSARNFHENKIQKKSGVAKISQWALSSPEDRSWLLRRGRQTRLPICMNLKGLFTQCPTFIPQGCLLVFPACARDLEGNNQLNLPGRTLCSLLIIKRLLGHD